MKKIGPGHEKTYLPVLQSPNTSFAMTWPKHFIKKL